MDGNVVDMGGIDYGEQDDEQSDMLDHNDVNIIDALDADDDGSSGKILNR